MSLFNSNICVPLTPEVSVNGLDWTNLERWFQSHFCSLRLLLQNRRCRKGRCFTSTKSPLNWMLWQHDVDISQIIQLMNYSLSEIQKRADWIPSKHSWLLSATLFPRFDLKPFCEVLSLSLNDLGSLRSPSVLLDYLPPHFMFVFLFFPVFASFIILLVFDWSLSFWKDFVKPVPLKVL